MSKTTGKRAAQPENEVRPDIGLGLASALEGIGHGVLVFNAESALLAFNSAACRMLELDPEFLVSMPTLDAIDWHLRLKRKITDIAEAPEPHALQLKNDPLGRRLQRNRAGIVLEVTTRPTAEGGMVRTYVEISDYLRTKAARDRMDQLLIATQAMAQVGGWEADIAADRVYWTEGIYHILEVSPLEYQPGGVLASAQHFFTPESMAIIQAASVAGHPMSLQHDCELEAITARGRRIWIHTRGSSVWENGVLISRTSVMQDVTEAKLARKALVESENRWKLALESTGDGVWDWHIPSGVEFFSKRLIESYGYTEGELANDPNTLDRLTHPDDLAQMARDREAHFSGASSTYLNEHRILCKNGVWKWVLSRGMVISRGADGKPLRMIGTHTDITERKNAEALIRQQAYFDTLTGLPNRRMLRDRLEQEIRKSRRDRQQLAILFIDLDHFKEVNDTLGHDRGDQLLVEAARRLKECVRESDTVARMGGDEFTIILADVASSDQLQPVLQKILDSLDGVFQLGEEQAFVTASIGITLYPHDATEIEDLFKNADQALYVAKGEGRNRFSFFTPALQAAAQTRVRLAADLRAAVQEAQFHVAYQPIIELRTGQVRKAEALIRWEHPRRGLVSPAEFIPIAESIGLIVEMGEWVFRQAAQQVKLWRQCLHPEFQISVNRSPVQFQNAARSLRPWGEQLREMDLPGNAIVVEITEGLLLDTNQHVGSQLLELGAAGIPVSLDDFGTGYSSLAYLQKFNIDIIKIDQSFVRHLAPQSTNHSLCKAIIVMAHELGMQVVAEGVETEVQRQLLADAGCDFAQGYLFSRPLSVAEFEAYLAHRAPL